MSVFADLISSPVLLTEGSVIERLRRDPALRLDPWVEHSALLYSESGQKSLQMIFRQYLDIGRRYDLPMLVFSPTWRANPERLEKAGLADRDVNGDAVRLLQHIREEYGPYASKILLGGLIGCRGDAYRPEESLSRGEATAFHRSQIRSLAGRGVDFLFAATLPAAGEAVGIAHAMAETSLPYVLSFVIGGDGALLDGTPIHAAVEEIDQSTSPSPAFYMVNCVHPSTFRRSYALEMGQRLTRRVIGLQANTSPRTPRELDGLPHLESEDPETLAQAMVGLHVDFGLRVLGGCCGTDDRHLLCLAEKLAARRTSAPQGATIL